MGFLPLKVLVLLLSCITVFGDEVELVSWSQGHHHHSPSYPPSESPKYPKSHPPHPNHHHHHHPPPSQPPVQPPSYQNKRSPVAVQGVVYCESCKYAGVDTLLEATPLIGVVVKLQCNNSKHPSEWLAETDKNGYFFIWASKLSTFGTHKCKVYLVSSPITTCNKPTNLYYGEKGAPLIVPTHFPYHHVQQLPFQLFTVGPFAFQPSSKCPPT